MNGKLWWRKVSSGAGAVVFAALMAGSLGGCKLLKPKEKKAFGAECVTDLDCESLTCSTDGNICSKSCTYDKECAGGTGDLVCRTKGDGTNANWCSKPIGVAPNGACMDSFDCQHNHCLKYVGKQDQPGICSKYCQTADDCPDGMKICINISDSGMLKLCIPGDPKADASAQPKFSPTPAARRPANAQPRRPPPPAPAPAPAPPPRQPDPAKTATPAKTAGPATRPPAKHR
jgi:hypothetical protein